MFYLMRAEMRLTEFAVVTAGWVPDPRTSHLSSSELCDRASAPSVSLRNHIRSLPSLSSNSLKLKVKPHLNSFWRLAWYTDQYLTLRHQRPALEEGVAMRGQSGYFLPPWRVHGSLCPSCWWFVDIEQPLGTRHVGRRQELTYCWVTGHIFFMSHMH